MATQATKSRCIGRETVSTKVDGEMRQWIEERADAAGVAVTELLRRLLDLYRASESDGFTCPYCDRPLRVGDEVDL